MSTNERLLLLLGIIVCTLTYSTNGGFLPFESALSTGETQDAANGRLPGGFIPSHYDIEITPDFYGNDPSSFTFNGSVSIYVLCNVNGSRSITLNSKGLTINENEFSVEIAPESTVGSTPVNTPTIQNDAAAQFWTLNFNEDLVADAIYIIKMNYSGPILTQAGSGIYYDFYKNSTGATRYMVATQFEATGARQMFPCFDEPDLKATFNVTVLRKESVISLSNMPIVRNETRENGWIADIYDQSPVMSTYLVCVCIGEFLYVEANSTGLTDHPIRIYARADMIENLEFARELAPKIHKWLEDETGVEYTAPKMDHIALPSKGGAMENWGLITYGESSICINANKSTALSKLNVASIISHELAHQWYGNKVTCKWWDDIWLNEGFATHYNYYPLAAIGWPSSENQQADPRRGTQQFLDIDQRNNSDPVIKNISTSAMAPGAFSGSTYPKGGAIVRMLKGLLPEATLKKGFTDYLNKFDSQAVVTDDLWAVLTAQAAADGITLNIKSVMDPWLKQMGYPLVTVTSIGNGRARVTANRYFNPKDQTPDIASPFDYQWTVPISVGSLSTQNWEDIRPSVYLNSTLTNGVEVAYDKWLVINANQMFFYRVKYDSGIHTAIVEQLLTNHSKISPESRGQVIDDSFSLARSLVIEEKDALETTRYLGSERNYGAWSVALKHLLYADKIFQNFTWYPNYKTYVTRLLQPVYLTTGWEFNDAEPPLSQSLRRDVSTTLCNYGHDDCVTQALARFNDYIKTPEVDSVDPNNLPIVLCVGVRNNDSDQVWNAVYRQYLLRKESPLNDERYAYLYGLSCSSNEFRLDDYLELIVGNVWIAGRDQTTALNYLVQNSKTGRDLVWDYFAENWPRVPSTAGKFTVLRNIASAWQSQDELNKFYQFIGVNPPSNSESNLITQIELLIWQNIEWINANAVAVDQWLINNIETSTSEPSTSVPSASDPSTAVQSSEPSTSTEPSTSAPSSSCRSQVQLLAVPLTVLTSIHTYLRFS